MNFTNQFNEESLVLGSPEMHIARLKIPKMDIQTGTPITEPDWVDAVDIDELFEPANCKTVLTILTSVDDVFCQAYMTEITAEEAITLDNRTGAARPKALEIFQNAVEKAKMIWNTEMTASPSYVITRSAKWRDVSVMYRTGKQLSGYQPNLLLVGANDEILNIQTGIKHPKSKATMWLCNIAIIADRFNVRLSIIMTALATMLHTEVVDHIGLAGYIPVKEIETALERLSELLFRCELCGICRNRLYTKNGTVYKSCRSCDCNCPINIPCANIFKCFAQPMESFLVEASMSDSGSVRMHMVDSRTKASNGIIVTAPASMVHKLRTSSIDEIKYFLSPANRIYMDLLLPHVVADLKLWDKVALQYADRLKSVLAVMDASNRNTTSEKRMADDRKVDSRERIAQTIAGDALSWTALIKQLTPGSVTQNALQLVYDYDQAGIVGDFSLRTDESGNHNRLMHKSYECPLKFRPTQKLQSFPKMLEAIKDLSPVFEDLKLNIARSNQGEDIAILNYFLTAHDSMRIDYAVLASELAEFEFSDFVMAPQPKFGLRFDVNADFMTNVVKNSTMRTVVERISEANKHKKFREVLNTIRKAPSVRTKGHNYHFLGQTHILGVEYAKPRELLDEYKPITDRKSAIAIISVFYEDFNKTLTGYGSSHEYLSAKYTQDFMDHAPFGVHFGNVNVDIADNCVNPDAIIDDIKAGRPVKVSLMGAAEDRVQTSISLVSAKDVLAEQSKNSELLAKFTYFDVPDHVQAYPNEVSPQINEVASAVGIATMSGTHQSKREVRANKARTIRDARAAAKAADAAKHADSRLAHEPVVYESQAAEFADTLAREEAYARAEASAKYVDPTDFEYLELDAAQKKAALAAKTVKALELEKVMAAAKAVKLARKARKDARAQELSKDQPKPDKDVFEKFVEPTAPTEAPAAEADGRPKLVKVFRHIYVPAAIGTEPEPAVEEVESMVKRLIQDFRTGFVSTKAVNQEHLEIPLRTLEVMYYGFNGKTPYTRNLDKIRHIQAYMSHKYATDHPRDPFLSKVYHRAVSAFVNRMVIAINKIRPNLAQEFADTDAIKAKYPGKDYHTRDNFDESHVVSEKVHDAPDVVDYVHLRKIFGKTYDDAMIVAAKTGIMPTKASLQKTIDLTEAKELLILRGETPSDADINRQYNLILKQRAQRKKDNLAVEMFRKSDEQNELVSKELEALLKIFNTQNKIKWADDNVATAIEIEKAEAQVKSLEVSLRDLHQTIKNSEEFVDEDILNKLHKHYFEAQMKLKDAHRNVADKRKLVGQNEERARNRFRAETNSRLVHHQVEINKAKMLLMERGIKNPTPREIESLMLRNSTEIPKEQQPSSAPGSVWKQ